MRLSIDSENKIGKLLNAEQIWWNVFPTHEKHNDRLRTHIRKKIKKHVELLIGEKKLENHNDYDLEDILDLSKTPLPPFANISISHCPGFAGYAITPKERPVGFDVELSDRFTAKVVARISEDNECEEAPKDPGHLWVAKEASYKSFLRMKQPRTVSGVQIWGWKETDNSFYTFQFKSKDSKHIQPSGQGVSLNHNCLKLGFATNLI